jgi:hypothetical protein
MSRSEATLLTVLVPLAFAMLGVLWRTATLLSKISTQVNEHDREIRTQREDIRDLQAIVASGPQPRMRRLPPRIQPHTD